MPPMSAAAMPRSSVSGPMCTRSAEPWSVAVSRIATVDRKPAIVQTAVDTSFGLMPVMRARSDVRRRRAHRVAERGVPEQPPQPDGDERDDDQDEQLARGDLDVEARVPRRRVNGSGNCVCSEPVR